MMDNKHQIQFFQDLDFDTDYIVADDITSRGFYIFVIEPDGRRLTYDRGYSYVREFHEWPNGARDWENFKEACREDWKEAYPGKSLLQ